MIVVDTSVLVDVMNEIETDEAVALVNLLLEEKHLAITDVVYAELLQGLRSEREVNAVKRKIKDFDVLRLEELADFDDAAALRRITAASGTQVRSLVDCLIAAVCIREDVPLLHRDKDFDTIAACSDLRIFAV